MFVVQNVENVSVAHQAFFLDAFAKMAENDFWLRHVSPRGTHSARTGRIFMKLVVRQFFQNLPRKFKFR